MFTGARMFDLSASLFALPVSMHPWLLAFVMMCVVVMICCSGVLIHRDITRFEIHLEVLAIASLAMVGLTVALDGFQAILASLAVATILGFTTDMIRRRRPGSMGGGDPWVFAALGLAGSATHIIPVVIMAGLLSFIVATAYSLARGKRFLRSMFPAALALVPAMLIGVGLQLVDALDVIALPTDYWRLSLSPDMSITLLAMGFILTVYRAIHRRCSMKGEHLCHIIMF